MPWAGQGENQVGKIGWRWRVRGGGDGVGGVGGGGGVLARGIGVGWEKRGWDEETYWRKLS